MNDRIQWSTKRVFGDWRSLTGEVVICHSVLFEAKQGRDTEAIKAEIEAVLHEELRRLAASVSETLAMPPAGDGEQQTEIESDESGGGETEEIRIWEDEDGTEGEIDEV